MKRADIVASILGIVLSLFIFYLTSGFPEDQVVRVGPAFFPNLVAAGLGIFSALLLLNALTRKYIDGDQSFSFKNRGIQRNIISVTATIVYCLLFEVLGFITCSILYLIFLMILLKDRQYIQIAITSVTVTIAVFYIFKVLLNISLPMGTIYGY